jgi:integrase
MIRRKDRSGYWFRGTLNGRTRQISLGMDYQEACRRLGSLKTDGLPRADLTVTVAAERWLDLYVKVRRTPSGYRDAEARIKRYLVPFLGYVLLDELVADQLWKYRLWLDQQGLKPTSVYHLLSDVRCMLLWHDKPFPRRLMPRLRKEAPKRVSDEEAQRLRELPEPYGFVCRLALGTGMRWGELCRAQSSHLDKRGFLMIPVAKDREVRWIPLEPGLLAEVRARVGRLVPFSPKGNGSFSKFVRSHAGLAKFHVHQLRHTFACQWLEKGRSIEALRHVLGHSSVATTERYGGLSSESLMREVLRTSPVLVTPTSPERLASGGRETT